MKQMARSIMALVMAAVMVAAFMPALAIHSFADDAAKQTKEAYLLVNIPYSEFYAGEVGNGVDAVTSATKTKKRAYNLAAGSYHADENSAGIDGVVYPVHVTDLDAFEAAAAAKGGTEVKDDDVLEYSVKLRGKDSPVSLKGQKVLFERPSYSYYLLKETPSYYKDLTIADGAFQFSEVKGEKKTGTLTKASVSLDDVHTDYAVDLTESGLDESIADGEVSAVVITDAKGKKYGLGHVTHIWRNTVLGWNHDDTYGELSGSSITNITYYTKDGVFSYDVNLSVPKFADVTTEFLNNKTLKLSGLPQDAENVQVSVFIRKGHSAEGYLTTEGEKDNAVAVQNGKAALTAAPVLNQEYAVKLTSDNYKLKTGNVSWTEETMNAIIASLEKENSELAAKLDAAEAKAAAAEKDAAAAKAEAASLKEIQKLEKSVPTSLKVKAYKKTKKSARKIRVSWKAPKGLKGLTYRVYISQKKTSGFKLASSTTKTKVYVTKGVKKNKTYYVKVMARKQIAGKWVNTKATKVLKLKAK